MQRTNCPATFWIVDDDENDQLFIRSAFLSTNPLLNMRSLFDGEELLLALLACTILPKLILLDINMPRMNGFEALARLRNQAEFADLPVTMLTTSSADADRLHSLNLGANQFLTKPTILEQLQTIAQDLSLAWELG